MGERTRELTILILGDIICFLISLWLMLLVRYLEWPSAERLEDHLGPFLILSVFWIFIFYISGLYDKHTIFLKNLLFSRILNAQLVNMVLSALLFIIVPFGITPRLNLVLYTVIAILLIAFWRLRIFNKFSPKEIHKAILLADGKEAIELADEINNNDRYNYSFIRIIDKEAAQTEGFEEKLFALIKKENVEIVVANYREPHLSKILPALFDKAFLKFDFSFLDFYKVYEDTFDKLPLESLHYDWFINNVPQTKSFVYNLFKRVIDILGALVLLLPAAIIFPFVYIAIKLEDKGDIFYRTERVGQYNKIIQIYKLRTKNGADKGSAALSSTLVDTKVGSFCRKTRLDELPQLLNVIKGDLSFIGPRPEMPALAAVYEEKIPFYNARYFLKPGLSGWAQINNYDAPRGGVDVERTKAKLALDLYYLKNRSVLLDVQVALKTITTLIMRTGT